MNVKILLTITERRSTCRQTGIKMGKSNTWHFSCSFYFHGQRKEKLLVCSFPFLFYGGQDEKK